MVCDDDDRFRIEKRVEVEKKPEMVRLCMYGDGDMIPVQGLIATKTISYKSAVEFGLIKE